MHFSRYFNETPVQSISLRALLDGVVCGDLMARAEESGCEGCYIEVARWNDKLRQWQRFAFEKVFGGEEGGQDGESARDAAIRIANRINQAHGVDFVPLIHTLPSWEEKKE